MIIFGFCLEADKFLWFLLIIYLFCDHFTIHSDEHCTSALVPVSEIKIKKKKPQMILVNFLSLL